MLHRELSPGKLLHSALKPNESILNIGKKNLCNFSACNRDMSSRTVKIIL